LADKSIIPGIKVDKGFADLAGTDGETTTQGTVTLSLILFSNRSQRNLPNIGFISS
jgi:fructose-bisphosphate aldolase class 1